MRSESIEVLNPYEALKDSDIKEEFTFKSIKDNIDFFCYWIRYGRYDYGKCAEKVVKKKVRRRC